MRGPPLKCPAERADIAFAAVIRANIMEGVHKQYIMYQLFKCALFSLCCTAFRSRGLTHHPRAQA